MEASLENDAYQVQNEVIKKWGSMVQRRLKLNSNKFKHGKTENSIITKDGLTEGKLRQSIYTKYHESFGAIDSVTFGFERHGVFVQKGVGRGHGINSGFVVKSPESINRDNQIKKIRTPQDWFNSDVERMLPELADKLAEMNADAVLNATKILIK